MRRTIRRFLVAATATWVACVAAWSQVPGLPGTDAGRAETATATQGAPAEGPTAESVPGVPRPAASLADLATTLERAIVKVRSLRDAARTEAGVAAVESNLGRDHAELAEMQTELGVTALTRLARRDLLDVRRRWQREQGRLDSWFDTLETRVRRLDEELRTVRALRDSWSRVRNASEPALPDPMRTRIAGLLAKIGEVQVSVEGRLDRVLALMADVSDRRLEVRDALDRIDRAQPDAGALLLRRNAPPLWQVRSDLAELPAFGRQLVDSVRRNARSLRQFAGEATVGFPVTIALLVVVAAAFVVARRRYPPAANDDPQMALAIRLLQRPYSAALLIVLTVALWSFPDAPSAFYDAVLVGLLVPLLRLLPLALATELRAPLFGLAGLWSIERLARLVTEFSVSERLVLFAVSAAALVGLGWTMRPSGHLRRALVGPWGRVAWFLGRVWLAVLAVAVAANIVGAVELAGVLESGALSGLYLGLVLLGAVLAIESLVTLAFARGALRKLRLVGRHGRRMAAVVSRSARLLAAALWIVAALFLFRLWAPVTGVLTTALSASRSFGSFELSLGKVLTFVVTVWVAVLLSRLIRFLLEEDLLTRVDLPRGVPQTISMLVHYGLVTVGLLFALGVAGFELTQFAIVLGALSVGIGFGLQNVVNNFVSGLILVFERPISVGDTVEVGTLLGTVRGIGIRASTIRTFEGAEVIVPNGSLLASELVNWTLSDSQRRLAVQVGVAYGSNVDLVKKTLVDAVSALEAIRSDPAPAALFQGFGDSSLDFELRAWTDDYRNWPAVRSDVVSAIEKALARAGIVVPFPQRDLHVKSMPAVAGETGG